MYSLHVFCTSFYSQLKTVSDKNGFKAGYYFDDKQVKASMIELASLA